MVIDGRVCISIESHSHSHAQIRTRTRTRRVALALAPALLRRIRIRIRIRLRIRIRVRGPETTAVQRPSDTTILGSTGTTSPWKRPLMQLKGRSVLEIGRNTSPAHHTRTTATKRETNGVGTWRSS
jgi:hypothetical protein